MRAPTDRLQTQTRTLPDRLGQVATAALYGSLALIGAVVFGALSLHPY